ncbi:CPBP family intramembrane glutamic endopeptidase [Furfurilactobacillus milii]|uniref:CPBP family intramembrane metalloprotease n=1 Tax=Furfurilactobacillus milii TaxID=2888272 RepID=A0A6N9I6Z9_9LACO|nr:CPBP family intramembrane glutamic endopeptidase [Furfurilactobacillus milii]MYV18236.1 CPBP family intramembrane metalloprotease [Furfurilactobacillus milii]
MARQGLTTNIGLRRWFFVQVIIQELILIAGRVVLHQSRTTLVVLLDVMLVLNLLGLILLAPNEETLANRHWFKRFLYRFNHYGQVFVQTVTVSLVLMVLAAICVKRLHVNANGAAIVVFIMSLLVYIPIGVFAYGRIESLVGRIVVLFSVCFEVIVIAPEIAVTSFEKSLAPVVKDLATSGFIGAVSFVIITGFAMKVWGFRLPRFGFSRTAQWWVIVLLALFCVGYVIFNSFEAGTSFGTLWEFDFHMKSPTFKMMLNGVEPGIVEEWMLRFATLSLMMRAFEFSRHQFGWSVAVTSILFGLFHLPNGLQGQSWSATFEQALSAASIGCLLAALYLYTRALWWPMLFHFSIDSFVFMSNGTMTMGKPGMFDWWMTVILAVIFIAITIFLLTGERGRNAKRNFPEFTGNGFFFGGSVALQTFPTR